MSFELLDGSSADGWNIVFITQAKDPRNGVEWDRWVSL